jgi:hypothetical protein
MPHIASVSKEANYTRGEYYDQLIVAIESQRAQDKPNVNGVWCGQGA